MGTVDRSLALLGVVMLTTSLVAATLGPDRDSKPAVREGLWLFADTDRESYPLGDPVHVVAWLTNQRASPVRLVFGNSCILEFLIEDAEGEVVYDLSRHRACLAVITVLELQPGDTRPFGWTWDQVDDDGEPLSDPGTFRVRAVVAAWEGAPLEATTSFVVTGSPLTLLGSPTPPPAC